VRKHVVGLISDTHGLVRAEALAALAGVELILHAGDVGGPGVMAALSAVAPVEAVFGNVDDAADPGLAAHRTVRVGGLTIHVSHGHELGHPTPELALAAYTETVVVFGHTHRAAVLKRAGRLAVNPGAAGPRRFDLKPSVARLTIAADGADVELISLA